MSKGQIFSTDLIFATGIFLILMGLVWYNWDDMRYEMDETVEINEMEHLALSISDALVMTSGEGHNWVDDPENATSIGLTSLPGKVSQERLDAFVDMDYDDQREKLGTGAFDFWFALKTSSGSVIQSTGSNPEGDRRISIVRPVIYNGEPSFVNLMIWRESYRRLPTYIYPG